MKPTTDEKIKRELYDALAKGIAYRFDHKKKEDKWSMRDIGVYGASSIDIVNEYIYPIFEKAITLAKEAERDKINNRLEHLIEVRADIRSVVKHVQMELGLKQKHTK